MSVVPYTGSRLSDRSYGVEPYTGSRFSDRASYGRSLAVPSRNDFFSNDRSIRKRSNLFDNFFSSDGDDIFDSVFSSSRSLFGQMDRMMGAMMRDPFGDDPFFRGTGFPALMGPSAVDSGRRREPFELSPFGGMMSPMIQENMMKEAACHSYSSSSVMTMTTGPDGRPQAPVIMQKTDGKVYNWRERSSRATQIGVGGMGNNYLYQASSSSRGTPGGVRETQSTMSDSRTGIRKMAIGHHIEDRSHVIEKEMNRGGDMEEKQEFVNLDEGEATEFDNEFKRKTQHPLGAIEHRQRHRNISPSRQRSTYLPALPSSTSRTNNRARNRERGVGRTRNPNNPPNPTNPSH